MSAASRGDAVFAGALVAIAVVLGVCAAVALARLLEFSLRWWR